MFRCVMFLLGMMFCCVVRVCVRVRSLRRICLVRILGGVGWLLFCLCFLFIFLFFIFVRGCK